MSFVQMMANLETAFNRREVNENPDIYDQSWESWVNSLTITELTFHLDMHGGA